MGEQEFSDLLMIDTHAHYYLNSSFNTYLDSAYENMSSSAREISEDIAVTAVLFLCETANSCWYEKLAYGRESELFQGEESRWMLDASEPYFNLRFFTKNEEQLYVLPSRQVVTEERLEVLIIGCREKIPHNFKAEYYLAEYSARYLVILPWGVGKWLGKRGMIMNSLIDLFPYYRFALGDNSGRPCLWRGVSQFRLAEARGIKILPGSDPLPVKGQYRKCGGYGVVLENTFDSINASTIGEALLTDSLKIFSYGKQDSFFNFISSQLRMRLYI